MKKYFTLALLVAFVFVGCSSPSNEKMTKSVAETYQEINKNLPVKKESNVDKLPKNTVVIKQMKFIPEVIQVHVGDTITWINEGIVAHNVTQSPDQEWTSGDFDKGESWTMVAKEDADYFCTIHPAMKGSIKIIKE